MTHWFEVPSMLFMLGSVKVLVSKDDKRKHRGARVKRTTVTAVECISADGRYVNSMIPWPATTHRSNWTRLDTCLQLIILHSIIDDRTLTTRPPPTRVEICAQREDPSLLYSQTLHNNRHTSNPKSRTACGLTHLSGNPSNCPTVSAQSLRDWREFSGGDIPMCLALCPQVTTS